MNNNPSVIENLGQHAFKGFGKLDKNTNWKVSKDGRIKNLKSYAITPMH